MANNSSDNRRIAKNTIYLYLRTLVVMLVSLYTSRLILQVLGETDLGIYNLVGGIVTLMAFLHTAQTKATSRFITYGLGRKEGPESLKRTFSICMTIHILISLVIFLIAETVGLYVVNYWTSIPSERIIAANWVYQFSVLTFIIHFIRVPFDSVIIAHENMSVYAYMSILEVALQLGMVFLLGRLGGDSLIIYAALLSVIAITLLLCYKGYVRRKYANYRFIWTWDKQESKRILSLSGWTLLGSTSNTVTQQGVSLLLNNFVGLVANTALGFAYQVNTAVGRFVSSFTTAFNPQVIKLYAEKDYGAMFALMNRASKISFVLCYAMALPLVVNMDFLLHLWLGTVPQYTVEFCQLIVVCTVIDATTGIFNTAITATGQVRNYQIGISISFLLDLVCSWLLLLLGVHPALVFGSRIITRGGLNMLVGLHFTHHQIGFDLHRYGREVLLPIVLTLVVTILATLPFVRIENGWIKAVTTTAVSLLLTGACLYVLILNRSERRKINCLIVEKINHGRVKSKV